MSAGKSYPPGCEVERVRVVTYRQQHVKRSNRPRIVCLCVDDKCMVLMSPMSEHLPHLLPEFATAQTSAVLALSCASV